MAIETTEVGRMKLTHPNYDTGPDGTDLHTEVKALWESIADAMPARFFKALNLAASSSQDLVHNFGVELSELKVKVYSYDEGTGEMTRLTEKTTPKRSEISVVAKTGALKSTLTLTNNSGAERDLAAVVVHDGRDDKNKLDIANNQSVAQDVPGVSFDSSKTKSARLLFNVHRSTDSQTKDEVGEIFLSHNGSAWQISVNSQLDDAGVDFSVTSAGQLQYTSSDLTGTNYSGTMRIARVDEMVQ